MHIRRYVSGLLCLVCILVFIGLNQNYSGAAQLTPTVVPDAVPLIAGRTVSGSLNRRGDTRDFIFTVPDAKDMFVWFRANKFIVMTDCQNQINRTSPPPKNIICGGGGGASDDFPSEDEVLYPAQTDPNLQTVVGLHLIRGFDAYSTYQLTGYAIPPKAIDQTAPTTDTLTTALPFQNYGLIHDVTTSFVVEAEENKPNGVYLWVAHLYYGQDYTDLSYLVRQDDAARMNVSDSSLLGLFLFYIRNNQFRLLVHSIDSYTVNISDLQVHTLDNVLPTTWAETVSYQKPVRIAVLQVTAGETLRFSSTSRDGDVTGNLYQTGEGVTQFPLYRFHSSGQDSVVKISQSGPLYVVMEMPDSAPRSQFSFNLTVKADQGTETPQ